MHLITNFDPNRGLSIPISTRNCAPAHILVRICGNLVDACTRSTRAMGGAEPLSTSASVQEVGEARQRETTVTEAGDDEAERVERLVAAQVEEHVRAVHRVADHLGRDLLGGRAAVADRLPIDVSTSHMKVLVYPTDAAALMTASLIEPYGGRQ